MTGQAAKRLPAWRVRTSRNLRILALLVICALLVLPAAARAEAGEAPRAVVSIPPLHSLVAGVMQGLGAPHLLLRGGASPHGGSLRPSDARALRRADIVFWLGPELERFLQKSLAAQAGNARLTALAETPGLRRLSLPGAQGEGRFDPHLWLDPANARVLVQAIAALLAEVDSGHAAAYRGNAARLDARLVALDAELRARLAPVKEVPYLVFHDAYRYFETRYGLANAGAFTLNPEIAPGARRLTQLRRRIAEAGVACVFAEPQFPPALARAVTGGTPARLAELDPLGAALEPGPEAYFRMMRALANDLIACLSGG